MDGWAERRGAVEPVTGGAGAAHLRLLGSWGLTGHGSDRIPLTSRRLTAYLALRGPSSREQLATALWPDADEAHAQGSLRSALWRLRSLSAGLVHCDADSASLGAQVTVDVADLDDDVRRLEGGELSPRLRALPPRLLLHDIVPGWYDEWLLLDRERVRQLRLHALEHLALALARESRFATALEAALAAVSVEPLRESAHRTVMRVHLREGNPFEALRHFDAYRRLVADELAVEPSPAMLELLPRQHRRSPAGVTDR